MNELMRRICGRAEIQYIRSMAGNIQCTIHYDLRGGGQRIFSGVGADIEEAFCDAMISVFEAAVRS